jgi:hypothetical protein
MKRRSTQTIVFSALASMALVSLVGCGGGGGSSTPTGKFDFSVSLVSGSNNILYLEKDETTGKLVGRPDKLKITEKNAVQGTQYTYSLTLSGGGFDPDTDPIEDYLDYTYNADEKTFTLTPLKLTKKDDVDRKITVSIKEKSVKTPKRTNLSIIEYVDHANAGFNYAADKTARQEILGKLEQYAMENYLTGITLFENGGYVRYADRVKVPATEYITGYGWGILADGELNGRLSNVTVEPDYLQSSTSSDPLSINAWDATGSQVSDLNGYISSSYWGTRLKGTDAYEWYPVLAKDEITVDGQKKAFNRPIHMEADNPTNLYKKWRIYVKTGEEEGIKYRTASSAKSAYNNLDVKLEDYEFVYQMLLSERSQVVRGSELAGDTSYGIKGGQAFFRKSKNVKDNAKLDALWAQMKADGELGINTGVDPTNGSYIELELVNPIDEFTAMYTLSSNLYTPIPKSFIKGIGGGDYTEGAILYGTFPTATSNILDYTLCVGPFYLKSWTKNKETIFARNDDWYEVGDRYHIPGVRIQVLSDITENPNAVWQHFNNGELDSTNIPKDQLPNVDLTKERRSGGDSTFKLNVNSCTQDEWNKLFGTKGSVKQQKDNAYICKPWMSNKNFLKGLYWSIDRESFAKARGVTPSINYFASSYMSDPEKGISYNSTNAHINAVSKFHDIYTDPTTGETKDNYGYNVDTAKKAFEAAIAELEEAGSLNDLSDFLTRDPTTGKIQLHMSIEWMYQTDIRDYGEEIGGYFKDAFDSASAAVSGGKYELIVDQDAVTQWDKVYNDYLMVGKFDLGFGAISGNSYNPLNFLEVLKSNNSSGFTLNWGTDTGVVDELNPIIYDDRSWSFDALWAAADHGTVVTDGRDKNPVNNCYLDGSTLSTNKLYEGGTFEVPFDFVDVDKSTVDFEVKSIKLYLSGYGTIDLPLTLQDGKFTVTISRELGEEINQYLVEGNELDKAAEKAKDEDEKFALLHPFTADKYDIYWNIEVRYTISINGGIPSENTAYAYGSKQQQEDDRK